MTSQKEKYFVIDIQKYPEICDKINSFIKLARHNKIGTKSKCNYSVSLVNLKLTPECSLDLILKLFQMRFTAIVKTFPNIQNS